MTDTPSKIQEFINFARSLKGYEKGEGQEFCVKLFQAFGHRGCIEAGAKLEYRIKSDGQHTKFADLVWRPRLLLEMKSRGEKLEKHHKQVFEYWNELKPKPRYVVLCNFDEFWIYDTYFQIEEPVNFVKLEELPKRYDALKFLFPGNEGFNTDSAEILAYENIPPNGVLQFVGREDEVKKLDELLQQQNGRKIAVIVGMGGVGKTEFAKQYSLRHLQNCRENKSNISSGSVCWLDGRDGDIARQIVSFARSFLNLNPPEDWDIPTQLNYCWRNWRTGEWLIVIDDVSDYGKIKPYLPPESSSFTILLTRRENLGRSFAHLPLETLQPQPALDLLKSLVGAERIEQELEIAEKICSWLGYLPLGLELVGRYLDRDPDLSLKIMFSLLEKKRLRHTSIIKADATMTAKLGVNDAFDLSWERLDENAQELGCMLSLFALADIPWELVKQAYQNLPVSENQEIDLDIVEEARGDLLDFNLLERTGQGSYRVHPLIREFMWEKREKSAKVDNFKQGFVKLIIKIASSIPDIPTRQQIYTLNLMMPHVAEVANEEDLRQFLSDHDLILPFQSLGKFYSGQGLYEQAEPWLKQCLSLVQNRFTSDHPAVGTSLINLAMLYNCQGRYKQAEALLLSVLEINQHLLGDNSFGIAISKAMTFNRLSVVYQHQGRYSEAETLLEKALEINMGLCINQLPNDLLYTTQMLSTIYQNQGRYDEAETILINNLELIKKLLPKDHLSNEHINVATILNNLAELYRVQKQYNKSEQLYIQSLKLTKSLLGEDHIFIATILNNLALLYKEHGQYSQAEHLYQKSLELRRSILGEKHPDVASSIYSLAELYRVKNDLKKAENFHIQALNLRKCLLDINHPHIMMSMDNLALTYQEQGRLSEAEILLLETLKLKRSYSSKENTEIAVTLWNLASIYIGQKKFNIAEPILVEALEIYKQCLGLKHHETVECLQLLKMLRKFSKLTNKTSPLPNFKPKSKKGNSQNEPKGFGKK